MKLTVENNQLSYTGSFTKPALGLWADGAKIFEGLLSAFSSFGVKLPDIRVDTLNQSPAGQMITADLRSLGRYAFRFHQVEWRADNLTENELELFPTALQEADNWLRSAVSNLSFYNHVLVYTCHGRLSESNSTEYLKRFSDRDIAGLGENMGAGVFYHWEIPNWGRLDFAVDHSRSVQDGLFVQASIDTKIDPPRFEEITAKGRETLERVLASISLEFES